MSQCSLAAHVADIACMPRDINFAPQTAQAHQFNTPTNLAMSRGVTMLTRSMSEHRSPKTLAASASIRNVMVRVSKMMPRNFELCPAPTSFLFVSNPSSAKSSEKSRSRPVAVSLQS